MKMKMEHIKICDTAEAVLRGESIARNLSSFHLKNLEKVEKNEPKASRIKEIIKINEIKNRKQ